MEERRAQRERQMTWDSTLTFGWEVISEGFTWSIAER